MPVRKPGEIVSRYFCSDGMWHKAEFKVGDPMSDQGLKIIQPPQYFSEDASSANKWLEPSSKGEMFSRLTGSSWVNGL